MTRVGIMIKVGGMIKVGIEATGIKVDPNIRREANPTMRIESMTPTLESMTPTLEITTPEAKV